MILYVKPARKDGLIPVTYVYPVSGKSIKKLLTPATLATESAKASSIRTSH